MNVIGRKTLKHMVYFVLRNEKKQVDMTGFAYIPVRGALVELSHLKRWDGYLFFVANHKVKFSPSRVETAVILETIESPKDGTIRKGIAES